MTKKDSTNAKKIIKAFFGTFNKIDVTLCIDQFKNNNNRIASYSGEKGNYYYLLSRFYVLIHDFKSAEEYLRKARDENVIDHKVKHI